MNRALFLTLIFLSVASSMPSCGQDNTLTIEYKSGTHEFKAINNKNVWRGKISIYPGECTLQVLSKTNNTASGNK